MNLEAVISMPADLHFLLLPLELLRPLLLHPQLVRDLGRVQHGAARFVLSLTRFRMGLFGITLSIEIVCWSICHT